MEAWELQRDHWANGRKEGRHLKRMEDVSTEKTVHNLDETDLIGGCTPKQGIPWKMKPRFWENMNISLKHDKKQNKVVYPSDDIIRSPVTHRSYADDRSTLIILTFDNDLPGNWRISYRQAACGAPCRSPAINVDDGGQNADAKNLKL
jgi:hypothetical protein